jgi:hypothetical protein
MAALNELQNQYQRHLSASENVMVENMNNHMAKTAQYKAGRLQALAKEKGGDMKSLIAGGITDGASDIFAGKSLMTAVPAAKSAALSVLTKGPAQALGESEFMTSLKGNVQAAQKLKGDVQYGVKVAQRGFKKGVAAVRNIGKAPDVEMGNMADFKPSGASSAVESNVGGGSNPAYSGPETDSTFTPPTEETPASEPASTTATPPTEEVTPPTEGNTAGEAGTAVEDVGEEAGGMVGKLKGAVTNVIGETGTKLLGKAAMGAPGVFDFAEDLKAGHVVGQSTGDKVGNVLTQVGTVLDFIPGLEWLGGLTGAAAAISSTVGEVEDKVQDDNAEKLTAASVNKVPKIANAFHSAVQAGHVAIASGSSNAQNTIAGSGTF